MIKAYLLIKLKLGNTEEVLEQIRKIDSIASISVVTGPFDVIVMVEVNTLEELYELTYITLSKIDGIEEIITHIVEKEFIFEEGE